MFEPQTDRQHTMSDDHQLREQQNDNQLKELFHHKEQLERLIANYN